MNRRQFFGASLAGIIAALCLPFERFAEWCGAWLRSDKAKALQDIAERIVIGGYEVFPDMHVPRGRAFFFSQSAFGRRRAYVNGADAVEAGWV